MEKIQSKELNKSIWEENKLKIKAIHKQVNQL